MFPDEYRRDRERCADNCAMQHRPFGEGSAIVWWGITKRGRTLLVIVAGHLTGTRYGGEIAQRYVILFIQPQGNNVTFQ